MITRVNREDTILVAIDFQEKLMPAMKDSEETIAANADRKSVV